MFELPSVGNTINETDAIKRNLEFREFITQYPYKQFLKGQIILLNNETPSGVFVIESGKVRTYTIASNGSEQLIAIHAGGEDIPVGFAFGLIEKSPYFYEAYTECVIRFIPKPVFLDRVCSDINLMHQIHINSVKQLTSTLSRIHALEQPRTGNKVALTLIYLADRLGTKKWPKQKLNELSVTQEEIANLLGMTRETVSYELNKLRIHKVISYSRKKYVFYIDRIKQHIRRHQ